MRTQMIFYCLFGRVLAHYARGYFGEGIITRKLELFEPQRQVFIHGARVSLMRRNTLN